ncbi:MAG: hypothetical protein U5L11_02650 [Arhodomonas sp.]|nr:hypothetical protein [Arhodomonas sp.]
MCGAGGMGRQAQGLAGADEFVGAVGVQGYGGQACHGLAADGGFQALEGV